MALERCGVVLDIRLNRVAALKIPHAHLVETAEDVGEVFTERARWQPSYDTLGL